jgi:hypothetical protein
MVKIPLLLDVQNVGGAASFKTCAVSVHKSRVVTWRNGKHQKQWLSTLET